MLDKTKFGTQTNSVSHDVSTWHAAVTVNWIIRKSSSAKITLLMPLKVMAHKILSKKKWKVAITGKFVFNS